MSDNAVCNISEVSVPLSVALRLKHFGLSVYQRTKYVTSQTTIQYSLYCIVHNTTRFSIGRVNFNSNTCQYSRGYILELPDPA